MKKVILFLLLCTCHLLANNYIFAQTATVTGRILNQNIGIEKATVSINDKSDFTDVDGKYRLKEVPYGRVRIVITKGDKKKEVELKVDAEVMVKDYNLE